MTTKLTSFDLSPYYRTFIGVDQIFDRILNQVTHATQGQNYPPYNIYKRSDGSYTIQVALAGFEKKDITVELRNSQLYIEGQRKTEPLNDETDQIYIGISDRKFQRIFSLADCVKVKTVSLKHGMLTVELTRLVPEELKPKTFDIIEG